MKILIACERFDVGGAETRILTLCRSLRSRGHAVVVASSGGSLIGELARIGATHHIVDFLDWYNVRGHTVELRSMIASHGIEIAHIHPYASLVPGILAAWQAGIPYAITVHGPFGFSQANWPLLPREGFADLLVSCAMRRPATVILAASPEVKHQLLKEAPSIPQDAVTVIPNAVDSILFKAMESNGSPRKFLIVSRLDPDKIPSVMAGFQAFRSFSRLVGGNCRLAIAGTGESAAFVQQEAEKLRRSLDSGSGLVFLGRQNRMWDVIPAYDVVIGMGRVIIEAGMCGRIPILAGYDGLKGVLAPEDVARYAETNFSGRGIPSLPPERIAEAVKSYPAERLGDLRLELISGFSAEVWTGEEEAILEQLLRAGEGLRADDPTAELTQRLVKLLYSTTRSLADERARLWRLKKVLGYFQRRTRPLPH